MRVMGLAQMKSLLMLASQLSGYPIPADVQPPPVELLTYQEMRTFACPKEMFCSILGLYIWKIDDQVEAIKVLEDEGYAGHSVNAITVHELTHWLQMQNWKDPLNRDCPREFRREYEAYLADISYEVVYEHKDPPEMIPDVGTDCPYTGPKK